MPGDIGGGGAIVEGDPRDALPRIALDHDDRKAASAHDVEVGEACRKGLAGVSGAVVAMDPYTGRVIALVNPQRGMASAYQPCSVFKIVVAVAGLTEGIVTPETTYVCRKGCWAWPGHGPIDLRRALAVSCNPYFEWIGEALGYEDSLDDPFREARTFYCTYAAIVAVAAGTILIPGVPLIPILFLTQALNAILLPPLLVFMSRMARDPMLMGRWRSGPAMTVAYAVTIAVVVASVLALAVLTVSS